MSRVLYSVLLARLVTQDVPKRRKAVKHMRKILWERCELPRDLWLATKKMFYKK